MVHRGYQVHGFVLYGYIWFQFFVFMRLKNQGQQLPCRLLLHLWRYIRLAVSDCANIHQAIVLIDLLLILNWWRNYPPSHFIQFHARAVLAIAQFICLSALLEACLLETDSC